MMGLTGRQLDCLTFIQRKCADGGKAPSFAEIGSALNVTSKSAVHQLLSQLEDRGYIRRLPGRSRAIALIDPKCRTAFFDELNPDVRAAVSVIAEAEGTTPEVLMRQWIRDRAEAEVLAKLRDAA